METMAAKIETKSFLIGVQIVLRQVRVTRESQMPPFQGHEALHLTKADLELQREGKHDARSGLSLSRPVRDYENEAARHVINSRGSQNPANGRCGTEPTGWEGR